jgi:hypothetical protein
MRGAKTDSEKPDERPTDFISDGHGLYLCQNRSSSFRDPIKSILIDVPTGT